MAKRSGASSRDRMTLTMEQVRVRVDCTRPKAVHHRVRAYGWLVLVCYAKVKDSPSGVRISGDAEGSSQRAIRLRSLISLADC